MPLLVHAADLHLDSPMRGLVRYEGAPVQRMRVATRRALGNLVELCLSEPASVLLLAGDLFDGDWRDYSTGLFFARQMARLKQADVRVVLLRGNHDAQSQITRHLELPDNVHELATDRPQSVVFEDLGVAVHGQGFATREVTEDLAQNYPKRLSGMCNVGLLHTSLNGRPAHESYASTTLDVLRQKGYDYWALGHVHAREVVCEDPWVVFCGNLQGRHARETGAKGATLVEVEDATVRSVKPHVLDVVRWAELHIDVSAIRDPHDVSELVRAALSRQLDELGERTLAVRLVLQGQCAAHDAFIRDPERWTGQLRACAFDVADDAIWIEKIRFNTRSSLRPARLREQKDAIGQLLGSLSRLREDEGARKELCTLFDDLRRKLPAAACQGDDALRLDDPALIADSLDDVEQLLLTRLLQGGEDGP